MLLILNTRRSRRRRKENPTSLEPPFFRASRRRYFESDFLRVEWPQRFRISEELPGRRLRDKS